MPVVKIRYIESWWRSSDYKWYKLMLSTRDVFFPRWNEDSIGGSGGGGGGGGGSWAHAPMGPNSFIFAYIFIEKRPRRRTMPPYRKSWISHWKGSEATKKKFFAS